MFLTSADSLKIFFFSKKSFRITISVKQFLDPDKARFRSKLFAKVIRR